jgi:formiminotetrahydrofolate cyclodeaminase
MDYRTPTVNEFLARIASENVTPAGGTAAAVVGAIGTSLCEMVCIHTIEHDEYASVAADMADIRDELQRQREHLLDLAERDATVVDELFSTTTGETDQSDIKRSIGVPLTIAVACGTVLDLAIEITAKGNRNALADAGTGVFLVHAALRASVFTVRNNLDQVSDQSFIHEIEQRITQIESRADDAHRQVMDQIEEQP